jgi:hypothetical protein
MENMKTMISSVISISDRDNQWLPPGNYFFKIKNLKHKYVMGTVSHEKGFCGDFEFKITELITMMANSQSSLVRKAGLSHVSCPNYPSPMTSPRRHLPNNYMEQVVEKQVCTICFEEVKKESNIEYCKDTLNCSHHFHKKCIIPWMRIKDTCPVCRKKRKTPIDYCSDEEELFPQPSEQQYDINSLRYNLSQGNSSLLRRLSHRSVARYNYIIHN